MSLFYSQTASVDPQSKGFLTGPALNILELYYRQASLAWTVIQVHHSLEFIIHLLLIHDDCTVNLGKHMLHQRCVVDCSNDSAIFDIYDKCCISGQDE